MIMPHQELPAWRENQPENTALVLPLEALDQTSLPIAGGKAANLGELIRAGFTVPAGFCVTTASYERASTRVELDTYLTGLESTASTDSTQRLELATAIRTALGQTPLPPEVITAVTSAYQTLSAGTSLPVSVRSSATAEDLPDASFAGQQETFLQVIGIEAVLTAVQQCFASLWTDRAIQYRASLGIAPRDVRLAVVVQRMVEAEVAGVLFTANPLTGKRLESVINANPGLGEAVVSGVSNPDHFVVHSATGEIVERLLGDKQVVVQGASRGGTHTFITGGFPEHSCLSDEQIRALAALGARVEAWYGTPQDIEWAIDAAGQIALLQARPITTLFPLPPEAPQAASDLRVYLAFGVQQGTYRPFTPMGLSALRLLASGFLDLIGTPVHDPLVGPGFITEAAERPFFEITAALRNPFGRSFLLAAMHEAEVQAAKSFETVITDPRLSLRSTPRLAFGRALVLLLARTGLPWYFLQALFAPQVATRRVQRFLDQIRSMKQLDARGNVAAHLAEARRLLQRCLHLAFRVSPVMLAGMQSFALARRLLGDLATESECQAVLGGSPTNPTTEMNLALWKLAEAIRVDASSTHLLATTPSEQLAHLYQRGQLSPVLQESLTQFLQEYGHQSVCELDLGVPRWSEDPSYVLDLLNGYQEMKEGTPTPSVQLRRAEEKAQAMMITLARRVSRAHWLRGQLVGWCLRRAHVLAGFREMTRFVVGLVFAQTRQLLWLVGEALVQEGRLQEAADIFFLSFSEAEAALCGTDLRERVRSRRATFTRELRRWHVPLVLLSDGTDPTAPVQRIPGEEVAEEMLQGTPASAGSVTGAARVIHDPHGAHLSAGEILVAPSTDPGWTPLFLQAAGLVMEAGGAMAHGAIVAREYGIPAVVGVAFATERIITGRRLTVDGTTGAIRLESED